MMKRRTILASTLAMLWAASARAMQDAGQTGEYDQDHTTSRGRDSDPYSGRDRSWTEKIQDLLDFSKGRRGAPKRGKGNPKKVDRSKPDKMDRSVDRSDRRGNRGGAYD